MMEPDIWPLDPMATAAVVVRVIDDIDGSSDADRNMLLGDLLDATWGGFLAQNQ